MSDAGGNTLSNWKVEDEEKMERPDSLVDGTVDLKWTGMKDAGTRGFRPRTGVGQDPERGYGRQGHLTTNVGRRNRALQPYLYVVGSDIVLTNPLRISDEHLPEVGLAACDSQPSALLVASRRIAGSHSAVAAQGSLPSIASAGTRAGDDKIASGT